MCGEAHADDAQAPLDRVDGGLDRDPESRRAGRLRQRPGRLVAQVGDQLDRDAGLVQVERGAIGLVMRSDDDDALADLDAMEVEIAPRRAGKHDPGPIVVGKDERPLDGACREHDLAGPHPPQPLARRFWVGEEAGLGQPFAETDEILRIIAERLRARHETDIGRPAQAVQRLGEPLAGGLSVDGRARLGAERSAGQRVFVADDDVGAALGRRARRGEAGGAGADDQHVAMGEGAVIAVRVGLAGRGSEAGGASDDRLVHSLPGPVRTEPVGPHEGLVIEAGADQRREDVVDRADVEAERRPAVLARRDEAVVKLDFGRREGSA